MTIPERPLPTRFLIAGLFSLAIVTFACTEQGDPMATFESAAQKRADYATSSDSDPTDFAKIFASTSADGVPIRTIVLGPVPFPTGVIVACDPFYVGEEFTAPFKRTINPGEYSVHLTLADFGEWGERVAFARLVILDSDVTNWEMAETTLEGESVFSTMYGVDAGLGILADLEAASLLAESMDAYYRTNPEGNYYDERLAEGFDDLLNYNLFQPSSNDPLFVPVFATGFGDGVYTSYWGLDQSGQAATLLTDFQLFTHEGHIFQ